MQYLINVIDHRSESGTVQEVVAINAFNVKLVAGTQDRTIPRIVETS